MERIQIGDQIIELRSDPLGVWLTGRYQGDIGGRHFLEANTPDQQAKLARFLRRAADQIDRARLGHASQSDKQRGDD